MSSELHLRIVTPARTLIDRKVASVQFMGEDGSYGVLPDHAPLMTATRPGIVSFENSGGGREEVLVTDGFAEVRDNVLSLICDAGELPGEIDVARAAEAERRARERIEEIGRADIDVSRAQRSMERAVLRQLLAKRSGTGSLR